MISTWHCTGKIYQKLKPDSPRLENFPVEDDSKITATYRSAFSMIFWILASNSLICSRHIQNPAYYIIWIHHHAFINIPVSPTSDNQSSTSSTVLLRVCCCEASCNFVPFLSVAATRASHISTISSTRSWMRPAIEKPHNKFRQEQVMTSFPRIF